MASYSIGDESDDEFDFQRQQQHQARGGGGGGAGLAPVSSRQPHQYVDPFDDDFASPQESYNIPASTSASAGGAPPAAARAQRSYDDALIFDDFTGGKPANPLGTASDVRDPHGTSDFNRYDVYEE